MRFLYVAICLLIVAFAVRGNPAYVASGGYYWLGNDAYTRSLVAVPGCYRGGCYVPGYSYYSYAYSHTYQQKLDPVAYANSPDVHSKLLQLAIERDRREGINRTMALNHAIFRDAVKAMGLEGNFNWQGYGQSVPYPSYGSAGYASGVTAGGNTVYGYSVQSIKDLYGDSSLLILQQGNQRLAQNLQNGAVEITKETLAATLAEGANRAKVAEILAKGQAVQEYLRALQGTGAKIQTQTYAFKVEPGAGGAPVVQKVEPPPTAGATMRALFEQSATQRCVACHAGARKEGNFDVTQFPAMPSAVQHKIMEERLLTNNEAKRMPRTAEGKAGERLTAAEIAAWYSQIGNAVAAQQKTPIPPAPMPPE